MKKKENFWTVALVLAVLIGLAITMGGCQPTTPGGPAADFRADVTSGPAPLTVQFTDLSNPGSSPITSWSWLFGDDAKGTSTEQDPSHTYNAAGTYNVSLTVTTANGEDTELKLNFISVISSGEGEGEIPGEGEGEGEGEIKIDTIEELQLIGNDSAYPLDGNYILTQNIDASATADWNLGAGFKPIGFGSNYYPAPFKGVFNGQNYIITGLAINTGTNHWYQKEIGLFESVSADGKVMNVRLENVSVTNTYRNVGGLVGRNSGQLINCSVTGVVMGHNVDDYAGGLVGWNGGVITNCYATATVTGWNDYMGGLVGGNEGVITNCYATGAVTGSEQAAGGLVGRNSGQLINCYATGTITNQRCDGGGLVGWDHKGIVTNCYATGTITGQDGCGGGLVRWSSGMFVGEEQNYGTVTASFWDTQTSGQTTSLVGGTGLSTAEMTIQATFAGAGWDFDSVWTIEEGCTYPYLQQLVSPFTGCVY